MKTYLLLLEVFRKVDVGFTEVTVKAYKNIEIQNKNDHSVLPEHS